MFSIHVNRVVHSYTQPTHVGLWWHHCNTVIHLKMWFRLKTILVIKGYKYFCGLNTEKYLVATKKLQTVTHAACPRCRGTTAGWWSTPAPCPRPRGTASPRAWPRWCWGAPGRGPAARRGHWSQAAASRHMSQHYTLSYKHWHRDKRWAGLGSQLLSLKVTLLRW